MKKAFTMIEIVMVIVILGVVSMISSDIIMRIYESYIRSNTINKLQSQTEFALEQISARLSSRIKYLTDADNHEINWTGYDYEGFIGEHNGSNFVGWSGFIDLNESNQTNLVSNGSRLRYVDNIIKTLSDNTLDINDSVLYFKDSNYTKYNISVSNEENITIISPIPDTIFEQYYISWAKYRLFLESDNNLTLKVNDKSHVLLENVDRFDAIKIGQVIRVKLCMNSADDHNFSFCKEKAIF